MCVNILCVSQIEIDECANIVCTFDFFFFLQNRLLVLKSLLIPKLLGRFLQVKCYRSVTTASKKGLALLKLLLLAELANQIHVAIKPV